MRATDDSPRSAALLTPSADGVQPEHPSQWWYWSGQLRGVSGRRYGVQLAHFAAEAVRGLLWGQMAHWAVVQLDRGEFTSGSRVWLGAPRRIEGRFALRTPAGDVSALGGDGRDRLRLALGALSLDLCAQGGQVVSHYGGHRHDYAFGGYTYYYSRPRMIAVGELRRGSERERVEGELWFDRQYGALSSAMLEGWQWFCVHLDDGAQLMIFRFNREAGERFAVVVGADGRARWLGPTEFHVEAQGHWHSPRSGVDYPCAWRVRTDLHPAWRRMVDHVRTVATQAVQLWMEPTLEQLGWRHPSPVLDAYDDPFNTWADMSCLLPREDWRGPTRPASLAYLVGPLHEHAAPPPPGAAAAGFQQRQVEAVKARARRWLDRAAPGIWPAASRAGAVPGFDTSTLFTAGPCPDDARLDAQYIRANVAGSERYVQSLRGSTRHRLFVASCGVEGLYPVGDWLNTGINSGDVEAATITGLQAARAILGGACPIPGEGDGWHRQRVDDHVTATHLP